MAFLILAPLLGSVLASLGLWLILLVSVPPAALAMTLVMGGPAALASLVAIRLLPFRHALLGALSGLAGATALVVQSRLLFLMQEFGSLLIGWWALVAFLSAQAAYRVAPRIHRPGRVAGLALGLLVTGCLIWACFLYTIT